jgi:hypothetical protein
MGGKARNFCGVVARIGDLMPEENLLWQDLGPRKKKGKFSSGALTPHLLFHGLPPSTFLI